MPLSLQRTVPPTLEPVTLSELKAYLRLDTADEDVLLTSLISAARDDIEVYLRRQLLPATWTLSLDAWPTGGCAVRLPRPPTLSVTSIKYLDSAGTLQTLASNTYQVDIVSEPARIVLRDGQSWPSLQSGVVNGVVITYVSGWATVGAVPPAIRLAVLQLTNELYEHREARQDMGVGLSAIEDNATYHRLLYKFRVLDVV